MIKRGKIVLNGIFSKNVHTIHPTMSKKQHDIGKCKAVKWHMTNRGNFMSIGSPMSINLLKSRRYLFGY